VIAGPNGAGKTTFAREFLPKDASILHFVSTDLIEIPFLRLSSPQIAIRRIAARVRQGGHDVPVVDVLRRYERGWTNVKRLYRPIADAWAVYDNSGSTPVLIEDSA